MKPLIEPKVLFAVCAALAMLVAFPASAGEPDTLSGSAPSTQAKYVYMNTTEITITFSAPKASEDIKKYILWITDDGGVNWRKATEQDNPSKHSIDYKIPTVAGRVERAYGFWVTKVNRAKQVDIIPVPGMRPKINVIIDQTPPTLTIKTLNLIVFEDEPLRIEWTANDEHFGERPISIYLGERRGDKWFYTPVDRFANIGQAQVVLPSYTRGIYKLRVVATDKAGNSRAQTKPLQIREEEPDPKAYGIRLKKFKRAYNRDHFRIDVAVDARYLGEVRSLHLMYKRSDEKNWLQFPGRAEQLQWFNFRLNRERDTEGAYLFYVYALGKKGRAISGLPGPPGRDEFPMPQGETLIDLHAPRVTSSFDRYDYKGGTTITVPFKIVEESGRPEVRILAAAGASEDYELLPVIVSWSENETGPAYTGQFEMRLPYGRWRYKLRIEAIDAAKNVGKLDFKTIEVSSFRNPPPSDPGRLRNLNEQAELLFRQGIKYMAMRDPRMMTRHLNLARNAFERSLTYGPDWPDTYRNLACVCGLLKDYIAAEKFCKKEIDFYFGAKSPVLLRREIAARINLSKIYFNSNHPRAAQHELELVAKLEHDIDDARIACTMLATIAKNYEKEGKLPEAYEAYSALLRFKNRPKDLGAAAKKAVERLKRRAG